MFPAIVKEMTQSTAQRRYVRVRRVDECQSLEDLFLDCLPAFGGAYLRRIYRILDRAIGLGCPLTLAIAGPVQDAVDTRRRSESRQAVKEGDRHSSTRRARAAGQWTD